MTDDTKKNALMEAAEKNALTESEMTLFHCAALVYGYAELARQSDTFGTRVFYNMLREGAIERFVEAGGVYERGEAVETVTVKVARPFVVWEARDIEAMREAVAEWDAKHGGPPKEKRPLARREVLEEAAQLSAREVEGMAWEACTSSMKRRLREKVRHVALCLGYEVEEEKKGATP